MRILLMRNAPLFLILTLQLCMAAAHAQNRISTSNGHAWFSYFGDHPVSKRWEVHLEGQWRRHDLGLRWQQLLLRPGVNFKLKERVVLTAGYGFVDTFQYGQYPVPYRFPEHRWFQQVLLKHEVGKLDFQHRYRLEQRFLGTRSDPAIDRIDSSRYENRFRHLTRINVPLSHDKRYYIGVFDEFFINFGRNVAANIFDQNRAYVALGLPLAKSTKIEVGYLLQTIQQRNGRVFEYNHTLQVNLFSNLPFLK
ncbi:MAG: DUF2490 domain-containing protein [Acidimicrobiia bacterium]|nr:DUF2490 domain-containing protein [Acidimicrobiia bacterium]